MRPRDSVRDLHAADLRRGSLAICWNAGIRRSGAFAGIACRHRGKASPRFGAQRVHRDAGARFRTDRHQEISQAGHNLALISAPYSGHDQVQGSLGVLGPTRIDYERAMTAVAYVAQLFSEALQKIE